MKKVLFIACFVVNCCFAQTDKKVLFTPESFIQLVRQYHPVVKQANIQVQKAEADILSSKGGFDPTIEMNAENKTFDGKNYYFNTNPEIKIPTPIGLDVKAGLEENGGQFLSSESSVGRSSYAGIDVALAKGMLMDKRRAALQQSKIFGKQSEQERLKIVNDILFDAYVSYWQWAGAHQLYNIYTKYFQIANDRLRLTRIAYTNGDRALVDTIEAYTQVQNFELLQTDALIKLNTAKFDISNFLWLQNDSAYLLPQQFVPDTIQFQMTQSVAALEQLITQSNANNPSLRSYDFKLQALEVERKLKFQNLLPVLNLKYNLLNKDYYVFKGLNNSLLENNYKWGIDFKLPIFIREGRGEYRKAKLKIAETNL
jgi:outer membrane protein TolC